MKGTFEPSTLDLLKACLCSGLRAYEVQELIEILADEGSVLEIREHFGVGMITSLIRIEGMPLGVIANQPKWKGGAIDADAGDKCARFAQLCDAFDIPILTLCDCPGFMVGPQDESDGLVRHISRMFVTLANIDVPTFCMVTRKCYGLGGQAMGGGSLNAAVFTLAWPTSEFGGMGLEGAVKLGYRKELEAIEDPEERLAEYERRVAQMYAGCAALRCRSFRCRLLFPEPALLQGQGHQLRAVFRG